MKDLVKIFQILLLVVIWGGVHAQYCLPYYSIGCTDGDGITLFQLGTIHQSIPCSGSPDEWYHDYTALSTNLTEGIDHTLTFQVGYANTCAIVYIDYNNNNVFDADELVAQGIGMAAGTNFAMTINIPVTVEGGPKRLRILTEWGYYPPSPCFEYFYSYGNCSDFTVNATPLNLGNLSGTVTNCCNGIPLIGATVSCGGMSATTGADGSYTITDIPPDTYTTTCTFNTLYSTDSALVTINSEQTSPQDFCLNPDPPLIIDAGANQVACYGYPPQACSTLIGSGAGGAPPYTYLWSNGETTQSITVCPAVTTVYAVTITDADNCTFSDDVQVCVVDVRCGNKLDKVQICHNGHDQCTARPAVPALLKQGALLGYCDTDRTCSDSKSLNINSEDNADLTNDGTITLDTFPNPFSESATFTFTCPKEGVATLKLIDHFGKETAVLFENKVEKDVLYNVEIDGSKLSPGLYFCVLQHSDGTMKIKKLLFTK